MNIERPLDLLNSCKEKIVIVGLKDNKKIEGILMAFDMHINIALRTAEGDRFYRGDNIICIWEKKEKGGKK